MRIEVRDLHKFYGATHSLRGASFAVPEGAIAGLLGPNGAGKSTTIRILTGLARATSGTATIGGFDVLRDSERIRARLGYLPELAPAYGEMTVEGFLLFMAGAKSIAAARRAEEVDRVLALLDLRGWRARLVRNLSKGTRQRVGIAQALLGRPKLVILDEPTAGLDPAQMQEVRALVRSLAGEATVLLSTHLLSEVESVCTHAIVLTAGSIVAHGTMEELRDSARETAAAVNAVLRGDRDRLEAALRGAMPDARIAMEERDGRFHARVESERGPESAAAALAAAVVGAGGELLSLAPETESFENVYLRLTQRHARAQGVADAPRA